MENIEKCELVEYCGIDQYKGKTKNFKQINKSSILEISKENLYIEQLFRTTAEAKIVYCKIVKTPIGESLEGQKLTGYKLLIVGDIKIKIQYVANEAIQGVYTVSKTIPFCDYIVLPKKFNQNTLIRPSIVIEDIYSEKIDMTNIYNNITMMLIAEINYK